MKIRKKTKLTDDIPASSTSDIAFLLIVFFMVITVFAAKEGFIIKTPEKEKTIKKASDTVLKVKISEEKLFVSNELVLKADFKNKLKEKKQNKKWVVLEIEKKSRYKEVIAVLDIFAELKIYDFSMKEL